MVYTVWVTPTVPPEYITHAIGNWYIDTYYMHRDLKEGIFTCLIYHDHGVSNIKLLKKEVPQEVLVKLAYLRLC